MLAFQRDSVSTFSCSCFAFCLGWGSWGPWPKCSKTCGGGHRMRMRKCDSPRPSAGMKCIGHRGVSWLCNENPCPGKLNAVYIRIQSFEPNA